MASKNILPLDKITSLSSNNAEPTLLSTFIQSQLSSQNNQLDLLTQQGSNSSNYLQQNQFNQQGQMNYYYQNNKGTTGNNCTNQGSCSGGGYFPINNNQGLQFDFLNQSSQNSKEFQLNKDNYSNKQQSNVYNVDNSSAIQKDIQKQFGNRNIEQHIKDNSDMPLMNSNPNAALNNEIINELQSQINSIKNVNEIQKETLDKLMSSIQLFSNEINNHKRITEMYKAKLSLQNQAYVNNINQHQYSLMNLNANINTNSNSLNALHSFKLQNNQPINTFQNQGQQHKQDFPQSHTPTNPNPLHMTPEMKIYHNRLSKQK